MNSPVEKIKEKLSIEEIVSSYIKLDKVGTNLKARCPFHNE
jgi:DNA primase